MIRFTLRCAQDHRFDSWFPSADAFDRLRASGHLICAECGDTAVDKAPMAPAVATPRHDEPRHDAPRHDAHRHDAHRHDAPRPDAPRLEPQAGARAAALQALKKKIEAETDYVGDAFAREARAIHDGLAPDRPIWGEARPEDARALIDDGVPIAPLPFVPTRKTN
jgi:hypothetical protein